MAGAPSGKPVWKGNHPVGQINAAPRFYKFAATGLGAAMWFFVSLQGENRRGAEATPKLTGNIALLQDEEGWPRALGVEASLGSLSERRRTAREEESKQSHRDGTQIAGRTRTSIGLRRPPIRRRRHTTSMNMTGEPPIVHRYIHTNMRPHEHCAASRELRWHVSRQCRSMLSGPNQNTNGFHQYTTHARTY
jgi:hypothetical protein